MKLHLSLHISRQWISVQDNAYITWQASMHRSCHTGEMAVKYTTHVLISVYLHLHTQSLCYTHFASMLHNGNNDTHTHTHTNTRLMALCPGLPKWAGTRKVKPIWILLEQEIVSGSGISWAICMSAPRSRQLTTPAPHYSAFLQAGCPSCRPTNSVKALKAVNNDTHCTEM